MPALQKRSGFTQKVMNFCNGSRLVREISDDKEIWTFNNASLSELTYQLNFAGSTGCSITGA